MSRVLIRRAVLVLVLVRRHVPLILSRVLRGRLIRRGRVPWSLRLTHVGLRILGLHGSSLVLLIRLIGLIGLIGIICLLLNTGVVRLILLLIYRRLDILNLTRFIIIIIKTLDSLFELLYTKPKRACDLW